MSIITNPNFWDCECNKNYIHPSSLNFCTKCYAEADEMPDSRQNEIDKFYNPKRKDSAILVEEVVEGHILLERINDALAEMDTKQFLRLYAKMFKTKQPKSFGEQVIVIPA